MGRLVSLQTAKCCWIQSLLAWSASSTTTATAGSSAAPKRRRPAEGGGGGDAVHINGAGSPAAPCNCAPSSWPRTGVSSTVALDDPCVSAMPHGNACAAVGGRSRRGRNMSAPAPHGTLETIVEASYCRSMMALLTICKCERARRLPAALLLVRDCG